MAKVSIDTDKISSSLLPTAKTEISQISNARSAAGTISFPNGEWNWNGVCGQIDDCVSRASKYSSWMTEINQKFVSSLTDNVDEINSITVEEVKQCEINVK